MKDQRGISLITLVVTMIVMLILIGVVGKYSLENIEKSNNAISESEFANVRDFTINMQTKILTEDYEFDASQIGMTNELLYILAQDYLSSLELSNIVDVNSSDLPSQYKYYYIPAEKKMFEDKSFTKGNITIQDVKNDYIVNFYTGTIIAFSESSYKVDGLIKSLAEIVSLVD